MAMMPHIQVRGARVVVFDPLMFIQWMLLGLLPVSLIAVLQQNNAVIVGKAAIIIVMGIGGLLFILALAAVKQIQIKWIGLQILFNKGIFLLVLAMLGATYFSQFLVGVGTSVRFGIVDVAQSKLFYAGVGEHEEMFFGLGLLIGLNALINSPYWRGFNCFVLNPILFSIYHLAVLPNTVSLLYVLIPRILFNAVYLVWAVPSAVMLTHWTWNWVVSSLSTTALSVLAFSPSLVMMLASPSLSAPLMVTLNCLPVIGLLAYKGLSSR